MARSLLEILGRTNQHVKTLDVPEIPSLQSKPTGRGLIDILQEQSVSAPSAEKSSAQVDEISVEPVVVSDEKPDTFGVTRDYDSTEKPVEDLSVQGASAKELVSVNKTVPDVTTTQTDILGDTIPSETPQISQRSLMDILSGSDYTKKEALKSFGATRDFSAPETPAAQKLPGTELS